jgi:stage III sporulation protein AH
MKLNNWKKNLVAAGVLVTVCVGIYANWVYSGSGGTKDLTDTLDAQKVMSDDMLVLDNNLIQVGSDAVNTVTDYFAAVRLSRQQARDSAVTLLQEAMSYGDQQEATTSSAQLEQIVQTALCEAQIESLVIAKGYADCVAYMSEDGISVAVASPEGGLQESDVALIADVVMSQSDLKMAQIHVVEVQ